MDQVISMNSIINVIKDIYNLDFLYIINRHYVNFQDVLVDEVFKDKVLINLFLDLNNFIYYCISHIYQNGKGIDDLLVWI